MVELLGIALLGGLITGFSPCIVPVVPVMVAGGASSARRSRPFLIIAGLVVSFSVAELFGTFVLSELGLPEDFLYWLGIGLLGALAVGLMVPRFGELLEKPFLRLGSSRYAESGGGFVLGLSLGPVFVPCAGPVLTAISAAAAHHRFGVSSLLVTLFYAVGITVPLLLLAVVAQRATFSWSNLRSHLPAVRRGAGVVLALTTVVIAFNLLQPLQRDIPGFTTALENDVESASSACKQLQQLSGEHANQFAQANAKLEGKDINCADAPGESVTSAGAKTSAHGSHRASTMAKMSNLPMLGPAPDFTDITAWLNTPGGAPLTLSGLRGKVVLVDFWTYSCINCQRSLPHVEAWYNDYKDDGFEVVGVSTPEFSFEHVVSNVRSAAAGLGIDYPVAIDDDYGTWDAYGNQYWPAEYLIDQHGEVRAYDFGEGSYSQMESNIRSLLTANGATNLPARTDVPNKTPTEQTTPESYVGYQNEQYEVGTAVAHDKAIVYHSPADIPLDAFAFNGTWDDHSQEATAGTDAMLSIHFQADDVYLVMGGAGSVGVSYNGRPLTTLDIKGIPKLYTL
ncbi:MAG TPA: cytochrome c biogenesis protein CcdA, partial [Acidimicrobiales bacterium]|nr:cytochrome c biogenesis protein CcdA [Acidimicrobiales bacterium]